MQNGTYTITMLFMILKPKKEEEEQEEKYLNIQQPENQQNNLQYLYEMEYNEAI